MGDCLGAVALQAAFLCSSPAYSRRRAVHGVLLGGCLLPIQEAAQPDARLARVPGRTVRRTEPFARVRRIHCFLYGLGELVHKGACLHFPKILHAE